MSSACRPHVIQMSSTSVHVFRTGQQLCIKRSGFLGGGENANAENEFRPILCVCVTISTMLNLT